MRATQMETCLLRTDSFKRNILEGLFIQHQNMSLISNGDNLSNNLDSRLMRTAFFSLMMNFVENIRILTILMFYQTYSLLF